MSELVFKVKRPVKNVPPRNPGRVSKYDSLYREIMLRLEQTPSEWVVFEFLDQRTVQIARRTVQFLILHRHGKRAVKFQVRGKCLYTRRGENYMKNLDL